MKNETISVADLRQISNLLFDYLENTDTQSFGLEKDFYWQVPEREKYDPYRQPADLLLGQLFDDWESLQKLRSGTEPIMHHFAVLGAILTYLGDSPLLSAGDEPADNSH